VGQFEQTSPGLEPRIFMGTIFDMAKDSRKKAGLACKLAEDAPQGLKPGFILRHLRRE
jgi:hypothetical protein